MDMKTKFKYEAVIAIFAILYTPVLAQGTVGDIETGIGGRASVQLDYKIKKGVHINADAELRTQDNFNAIGRYQATIGGNYKINTYLKAGLGYVYMSVKNSSGEWNPRHRIYADVTGTLKSGDWHFSLKEKLQLTHRSGVNVYQTTPNALSLKSRIKAEYKGFASVDPYIFLETRTALNDPACTANWNGTAYSDYSFGGYNDVYFNRLRGALGLEWELDKHNSIDFTLMLDYCYDKDIDTNSSGTKLKSLTYDRTLTSQISVGYKYSF
jgi:hypothetical protein